MNSKTVGNSKMICAQLVVKSVEEPPPVQPEPSLISNVVKGSSMLFILKVLHDII